MRVLVVGGTGHTGERLVRRLIVAGHEVKVLSRKPITHPVVAALARRGAIVAPGDCTRLWTLFEALDGCDMMVSCAHIRHAAACVKGCREVGVKRYLQMSSTRRFTRFPCTSSREVVAGESAIEQSGLDYTILRATMIFGGRRDANLTRLVAWFRRHRWFPLFGNGKNLVQPVFVEDLLDAFMAAILRPESSARRTFTIAGPESLTQEQFLRQVAQACGRERIWLPRVPLGAGLLVARILGERGLTVEQVRRFAENKDADISAACEALGYAPRSFADAIALKVRGEAEVKD